MTTLTPVTRISQHPLTWKWPPLYDERFIPYTDLAKRDIICGLESTPAPEKITVQAGSTMDLLWKWPGDSSHPGCIMTYMAPCNGPCKDVDISKLEFVKIQESCVVEKGGKDRSRWATDVLIETLWAGNENPKWERYLYPVTIPKEFADGEWVMRSELMALMFNEKQFYPNCGTFEITGGGDVVPKGTLGTELYSLDRDPGLRLDFSALAPVETFQNPGPPLYQFGQGSAAPNATFNSGSASPSGSSSSRSSATSSARAPTTSSTKASTTSSAEASATPSESPSSSNTPTSGSGRGESDSSSSSFDNDDSSPETGTDSTSSSPSEDGFEADAGSPNTIPETSSNYNDNESGSESSTVTDSTNSSPSVSETESSAGSGDYTTERTQANRDSSQSGHDHERDCVRNRRRRQRQGRRELARRLPVGRVDVSSWAKLLDDTSPSGVRSL